MRKELVVFVPTMERNEEASVSSVTKDRKFIILTSPTGQKTSLLLSDLRLALDELDSFYSVPQDTNDLITEVIPTMEVEYGE